MVVDDCWSVKSGRDNVTNRIVPDPQTFPSGINGTAQQIHDLGLKIGIYSSKLGVFFALCALILRAIKLS